MSSSHKGSAAGKRQKLSAYDPEERAEIQTEERGEDIAADIIARNIRALLATPGHTDLMVTPESIDANRRHHHIHLDNGARRRWRKVMRREDMLNVPVLGGRGPRQPTICRLPNPPAYTTVVRTVWPETKARDWRTSTPSPGTN